MSLGDAVRADRKRIDATLSEVAGRAGLSVSYVCDIEHGRRTCPARTAVLLADAVGVAPARYVELVLAKELEGLDLEVVVRMKFRGVP